MSSQVVNSFSIERTTLKGAIDFVSLIFGLLLNLGDESLDFNRYLMHAYCYGIAMHTCCVATVNCYPFKVSVIHTTVSLTGNTWNVLEVILRTHLKCYIHHQSSYHYLLKLRYINILCLCLF